MLWEQGAQTAHPRSWGAVGGWAGLTELPQALGASDFLLGAALGRGERRLLPGGCALEAGGGRGGCCNPGGAAGLRALGASRTCWSEKEPGRNGPPEPAGGSRRALSAPAAGVPAPGAPSGLFRPPGSPRARRAPRRLRRPLRRPEPAAAGPSRASGGSRGPRSPHSRSRDWSPPLQRQRLRKEGVRLRKAECRGEIRLGNQEKGREGERRLHMTSRSQ